MMPEAAATDPYSWAEVYRKLGWLGTLPLKLGTKWPPPTGFTGDGGDWPSGADVHAWQERGRAQNIALRLPREVVALDVDSLEAFTALSATLGALPPTWRSQGDPARRGHLFYRLPSGATSEGMRDPCPGVELLRHGHRYSVVAPSLHPSGSTYRWWTPKGTEGGVPPVGDLPELPGAWLEHMLRPPAPVAATQAASGGPVLVGGRDADATSYAASLRRRGLAREEAEVLMAARWASYEQPAGDHYELTTALAKLDTAWTKFEPRAEPVELVGFKAPAPEQPAAGPGGGATDLPGFVVPEVRPGPERVVWADAFAAQAPVEWIVPGVVPRGAGVVLYSPPGVGKSLLTLEWAVTAARAGFQVTYVDQENDLHHEVVRRLAQMGVGAADLENLRFYSFPEVAPLDSPAGASALMGMVEGSDLVVLDTISRMVAGEENSNDTWNSYYRLCGMALKAARIACLRLDHAGKDAEKGQRGGSAKSGDVDLVWRMTKIEEDQFSLVCEKNRMPVHDKLFALNRMENPLRHERVDLAVVDQGVAKQRIVWDFLQDHDVPLTEGRDKIKARLLAAGVSISNRSLGEVLKAWKNLAEYSVRPSFVPNEQAEADGCLAFGASPPPPIEWLG